MIGGHTKTNENEASMVTKHVNPQHAATTRRYLAASGSGCECNYQILTLPEKQADRDCVKR